MNQGDVLGIVGESGSGKSVTAYSVMGLTAYPGKLVGGTVWFNGHEIEKMKEKDFRKTVLFSQKCNSGFSVIKFLFEQIRLFFCNSLLPF